MWKAKFELEDNSKHLVPAYEASQSLTGISRAMLISSHYLATGDVRHRYPFSDKAQLFLEPPRSGSFEAIFQWILTPQGAFCTSVGAGLTANLISNFTSHIWGRVLSSNSETEDESVKKLEEKNPGSFDALVEATETGWDNGHFAIGRGATNIVINGDGNQIAVFNSGTAEYLKNIEINNEDEKFFGNVSSFNVNSRHGRIYIDSFGKTVAFKIVPDPTSGTISIITGSMDKYVRGLGGQIAIVGRRQMSASGALRKIIVKGAIG